jgi:ubiquinone/menaquinone biosynthesis C-methylase UbiE
MLTLDMNNYLSEISRVLKKNGRCLISYFLLNSESRALIDAHLSSLNFHHVLENCRVNDMANPEIAVAYEEEYIRGLYSKLGLEIVRPIKYGLWCGRKPYLSYQDIIVASKEL